MAWPGGDTEYTEETIKEVYRYTGIRFGRAVTSTHTFDLPEYFLKWKPTCSITDPEVLNLAEQFLSEDCTEDMLFYVWGHSYEFEESDNWDVIETFAKTVGNRDDVWYATNIEIYNYMEAQKQLNEEFPGRVFSKRVDISVKGEIEAAIDEACRVSGRIDMLFNNAGRPMTFPTSHINPDDFRKLVDLNYIGVAMGTLKVLPMMEKAGKGYVINAASMGGLLPFPYQAAYASTKAAVISFTQCLAYEYDGTDIHFMQYSPTNVATNIFFAQQAEEMRKAGKTED